VRYETRNDGGKKNIRPEDLPRLGVPFSNGLVSPGQAQPSGVYQKQRPKDRDLIGIEFLRELAERSGARYLRSESAIGTSYALALVANEIRNQYTLADKLSRRWKIPANYGRPEAQRFAGSCPSGLYCSETPRNERARKTERVGIFG
jgi:hypothetical protein